MPSPLDHFLEQWWRDRDDGKSHSLEHYLELCPGDSEAIAREYLALKDLAGGNAGPVPPADERLGHYRILRRLGGGGQGVVYLARDLRLSREVAIKKLRGSYTTEHLERFRREAQIASKLDHPGICPIYDIDDHGEVPYFVMRYVEGKTLSAKLDDLRSSGETHFRFVDAVSDTPVTATDVIATSDPSSGSTGADHAPEAQTASTHVPTKDEIPTVLRLVEQAARALHEAHEAGVVHRDIKPANIIVTPDGQPVLLDFGLATMTHGDELSVTATGQTPGTPAYMSPEQMAGRHIRLDRRTDVYSLGVTLYECLTLKRPFDRTSQVERQVMFVEAPDPCRLNAAISKDLKTVIFTALEKDRDRRYPSASELADDLRRVREHEPIKARPVGPIGKLYRWTIRNPVVAASVFVSFFTLLTGLIVTLGALEESHQAKQAESEKSRRLDHALTLSEPMADLQEANELEAWSDRLWPAVPANAEGPDGMAGWIARARALLGRKDAHAAAHRRFADPKEPYDAEERRQRLEVLDDLEGKLAGLPSRITEMETRLAAARTLPKRTIEDQRGTWGEIAVELAKDPAFAAISPLKPQLGLVPLGKNPEGCFEFLLADTGSAPWRDPTSRALRVEEGDGVVLVLVPGGAFECSSRPPAVDGSVPPGVMRFPTAVEPFLIGKHEVSQAQWVRVMGSNPSVQKPPGIEAIVTSLHPVESMSWFEASDFCRKTGGRLPTQDEWECVARSRDGRIFGDVDAESALELRENLMDVSFSRRTSPQVQAVPWDDEYPLHAPIGSFQPNGFGLHHVLGNVSEWCSDVWWRNRTQTSPQMAEACEAGEVPADGLRVMRGGNFQRGTFEATVGWFGGIHPRAVQPVLGFRIARSVVR